MVDRKQDGVRWYAPNVLAKTGALTAGFALFDTYFDKRELQGSLPVVLPDKAGQVPAKVDGFQPTVDLSDLPDVWITYGADTGDSDGSTERFAQALVESRDGAAPALVILGGDQVYPLASQANYEDRLLTPWSAGAAEATPTVLAIPGNHDWYDGLNAFLRIFAQGGRLGDSGCRLVQGRSYWTVRLADGLWIWGADIEFGAYIDAPQRSYFTDAARVLAAGDQVILCVSKPFWYHDDADRQRNVAFLEGLVEGKAATVPAILTGDVHHHVHLRDPETGQHRITSGGGGAFCHPTHRLEGRKLRVHTIQGTTRDLELQEGMVPDVRRSRRMTWLLAAFPWRNPTFALVPALLTLLYLLAAITTPQVRFHQAASGASLTSVDEAARSLSAVTSGVTVLLGSPGAVLLDLLLLGLLVAFAQPGALEDRSRFKKWRLGLFHTLLWMGAVSGSIWVAAQVAVRIGSWEAWVTPALALVLGALLGSFAMGGYLAVTWRFAKWNGNEAFSAIRRNDLLHYLRIHVCEGKVTILPTQLPPSRRWVGWHRVSSWPEPPTLVNKAIDLNLPSAQIMAKQRAKAAEKARKEAMAADQRAKVEQAAAVRAQEVADLQATEAQRVAKIAAAKQRTDRPGSTPDQDAVGPPEDEGDDPEEPNIAPEPMA